MKKTTFLLKSLTHNQLVSFLFCTILLAPLSSHGQQLQKPASKNTPIFKTFSYAGDDQVYKEHPLQPDEFYSPILQGCYPDPSITRKGDDYYLVDYSFAFFPGFTIFYSNDLVTLTQKYGRAACR